MRPRFPFSVFPTSVGVFLWNTPAHGVTRGLPHVRGGVSPWAVLPATAPRSSPRPWGCFQPQRRPHRGRRVFPTSVGVFPRSICTAGIRLCLPHVRGGVSDRQESSGPVLRSSPRPWGCFYPAAPAPVRWAVFPTSVGVFPNLSPPGTPIPRLPHVRGGVSYAYAYGQIAMSSSPRPWGCFHSARPRLHHRFVFPTSVGVFLSRPLERRKDASLPHVRGGVSNSAWSAALSSRSSPRPWGCFLGFADFDNGTAVFPTSVGVFLSGAIVILQSASLPHVRGGVSYSPGAVLRPERSSPRPWGCFHQMSSHDLAVSVFPTSVGVFPGPPG